MTTKGITLLMFITLFMSTAHLQGAIIYVDASASCPGNGSSWGTAYCDLQSALTTAVVGDSIWVANGTYFPTTGTDRTISFTLVTGVGVFGGFAGGETAFSQRDFVNNIALLSGDIGTQGSITDNSYHVVVGSGTDTTAILDGFTIMAGNANGSGQNLNGGGIYVSGGGPWLRNVIVSDHDGRRGAGIYFLNSTALIDSFVAVNCSTPNSGGAGGGMHISGGSPKVRHGLFELNRGGNSGGGGLYCVSNTTPWIYDCIFLNNNTPREGGGMLNEGSVGDFTVYACSFLGNTSGRDGAGARNESGANVSFINCVFSGNTAGFSGGGISNASNTSSITHCTFFSNQCGGAYTGGAIFQGGGTLTANNNIFWQNRISANDVGTTTEIGGAGTANVTNSIFQDGTGPTIYDFDPGFINDIGGDNTVGTLDDNLRLGACSPAVDTGGVDTVTLDREGNSRPFDGNVDGNAKSDPGAYESHIPGVPPTINFTKSLFNCGYNISCFGESDGSATVSPLFETFLWDNGDTTNSIDSLVSGTYTITVSDSLGCVNTDSTVIVEPNLLQIDSIIASLFNCGANVSCNGGNNGTAEAHVSGGCAPYNYVWSSGSTSKTATGLSATTYTVTITDANGCTASDSTTLTEPTLLVSQGVTPTVQGCGFNISCNSGNDGAASLSGSGGCLPYSYLWSNGDSAQMATNMTAGLQTVVLTDANGCTVNDSVILTEPTPVEVSDFTPSLYNCGVNITCFGAADGTIIATAAGGCAPYSYAWNNGDTVPNLTGLTSGTYTLTLTDFNNCVVTDSVVLTEPQPLFSLGITPSQVNCGANVSCNGGNDGTALATFVGGCQPYSYAWTGGDINELATNLTAGVKIVVLTDANACVLTDSITLTEPPALVMDSLVSPEISPGANVTCSGATDGSATAHPSGGCPPYSYLWSNGDTTATADSLTNGPSTVTITDANGCTRSDTIILIDPITIVIDSVILDTFSCGYNVSCFGLSNGTATVHATGGTLPYSFAWTSGGSAQIETNIPAGPLTVSVTDSIGCSVNTTVTLTEPAVLQVDSFRVSEYECGFNIQCAGTATGTVEAVVSGGCAPYAYTWASGPTTPALSNLTAGLQAIQITDTNGCIALDSVTLVEPTPVNIDSLTPSFFACGNNISCNGGTNGSIFAHVSGGCAPYGFAWSNGDTVQFADGLPAGVATVIVSDTNGCALQDSLTLTEPAPLVFDSLVAGTYNCGFNVTCNGESNGSATAYPGGGCPPYSFLWVTGDTTNSTGNLAAGSTSVIVSDNNGCVINDSVSIVEPAEITITFAISTYACGYNVSCNGSTDGTVRAVVAGGCAPYSYIWGTGSMADSLTNIGAGAYSVTVFDANGCLGFANVTLTEPAELVSDSLTTSLFNCGANVSCFNGTDGMATMHASGGCGPYAYLWGDGQVVQSAINLTAGTATVVVTDSNGCTVSDSVVLVEPTELLIDTLAPFEYACSSNISCNGLSDGSMTVTASGGCPPYQYLWSNGDTTQTATGLSAGTTSVTVTDANGCTRSDSLTLLEPPALAIVASPTFVSCNGFLDGAIDLTVTGGAPCGSLDFVWLGPNAFLGLTEDITGLEAGSYAVTVTDTHGCSLLDTTQITEPNPLSLSFAVNDESCTGREDGRLEVNISGGTPTFDLLWNTGDTTTVLEDIPGGTYTVTVTDFNNCVIVDSAEVGSSRLQSLIITTVGPNSVCLDDTLTLSTPSTFVSYAWSTGDTTHTTEIDTGGFYSIIVTDTTGCQRVDTLAVPFIPSPDPMPIIVPEGPVFYCDGDTLSLDAGAGYFSYEWNTGFTGRILPVLQPGGYSVLVFNGFGCSEFSDTVWVDTFMVIRPTFTRIGDTLFASPATNYQWWYNGAPITNSTDSVVLAQRTGCYQLCAEDTNGCIGCSDTLCFTVGIEEELVNQVQVYPNPTSGNLFIQATESLSNPLEIKLIDLYGRAVRNWKWTRLYGRRSIEVTDLSNGMYFLEITTENRRATWKIMLE